MKVCIPREITDGETRVSIVPAMVGNFTKAEHEVFVETGAGIRASFTDEQYEKAGAKIVKDPAKLFSVADIVLKFQRPKFNEAIGKHEVELLRKGAAVASSLLAMVNLDLVRMLAERGVTSFAMEHLPRISRAQSMDVLSSMSTVAGYKAVLVAANHMGKFFPLLMTAAGTIPPASVLILGAGVAGLQAIATARRLGAKVEAFDPRPAVREQVESLGVFFIEMPLPEDVETAGGYAKEQSEEFLRQEREVIATRLSKVDAVITTAQILGKPAPLLITEEMVKMMKPRTVIVDLAAAEGGNCELTEPNEIVEKHGVTIYGPVNLASTVPVHASEMHSKNMVNLFTHLYKSENGELDFTDEITKNVCITHRGEIINERVRDALKLEKAVA
ncbi:Re/Si-specific NAD(P)(+) transhydrogenase subunit alpha [bacterium]|nr:Re/Si-specific NAD(P)(+) transhydrogenase subunit alpha [bacterium]